MKQLTSIFILSTALLLMGCGGDNHHSDDHGHSHGDDGDHTHEQRAQQTQNDHGHSHGGDGDHTHEQRTHQTQNDHGHSHGDDGDHSHEQRTQQTQNDHGHSHGDGLAHHHDDADSHLEGAGAITKWTDKTELFMEYPELIVGRRVTFAVHLTRLSDFKPLSDSEVEFVFSSERGMEGSLTETQARIPGIYGPVVVFDRAGRYNLTIIIKGMVNDTLQVNGIPVYASADRVPHSHADEDPNLITFLKEQQWTIPFGTQRVGRRTLSTSVFAHGELLPVQSREVVVSAPFSGIILSSYNQNLPIEGQTVQRGTSLVQLSPSIQSADGENYAEQFINAQSRLTLAQANLERSERLYESKAISQVELENARIEYRQARIQFQTINEIFQIDTASVDVFGDSESSYRFEMKAPISGIVVDSYIRPGMQVNAGEPLVRIADMSRMWLSVHVPASKRSVISNPRAAVFHVQGSKKMYEIDDLNGRLVSAGRQVDPQTRTVSLTYEIDNKEGLHSGLFVTAEIDSDLKDNVIAIPESALTEEEGNFVVFVQIAGESFEKRIITTGIRNRGWVEVLSGVAEGEHVVTINPYQVKLASLTSEAPAHGHSH